VIDLAILKAAIFDDEVRVCELIRRLVDWDALGITLTGVAHTGVDALELLKTQRPEIAISDIRMPGYDGIALLRKTREIGLNTKFIMISGYKQFDYAREGLQLGAADYLLKPIHEDELRRALENVIRQYADSDDVAGLKRDLSNSQQALRKQFVQDVCERRLPRKTFDAAVLRKRYALDLAAWVCVACFHIDCAHPVQEDLLLRTQQKLTELIERFPENDFTERLVFVWDNDVAVLCAAPQDMSRAICAYREAGAGLAELQALERNALTMGVAATENENFNAMTLLESAAAATENRLIAARPIIFCDLSARTLADPAEVFGEKRLENLSAAIRTFSLEKIEEQLILCADALSERREAAPIVLRPFFARALAEINYAIGTLEEKCRDYIDRTAVLAALNRRGTVEERFALFLQLVGNHLRSVFKTIRKEQNHPVQLALQFVEKRYMEAIGLNDIADEVWLNPVYLSGLFKKETGRNFKDYLIKFRIDKAKELLRDSNLNVAEVSESVGYKDTKYFSKLFAQNVGMNPSRYRKLYRGNTDL
jgi:two-component system response regulator YesN